MIEKKSKIEVKIYGDNETSWLDILAFIDSLEFVPIQHDPRWSRIYRMLDHEKFFIAVARKKNVIIGISTFTIYEGPFGNILHANPYMGYGGVSCIPGMENEVIRSLMIGLLDWSAYFDCITVSVSTPPFSEAIADYYISALEADLSYKNFYQYHCIDRHPFDNLTSKRRHAFASEVRRAESSGIKISQAVNALEVENWLDIYEERYAQIGARILPRTFQMMLWNTFAPVGKAELHLACQDGQLLGGTLFLIGSGIVDYFSTAFRTDSMKLYPGTLILHRAFNRFIDLGIRRFNWQSSPSRNSGVYAYKKRWGALEGEHLILTKILGDPKVFLQRPLHEVRDAYGGHFVLPYQLWE